VKRTLGGSLWFACLLIVSTECRPSSPGFALPVAVTPASTSQGSRPSDDNPSLDLPTPLDPAVRFGRLANGLTYYVLHHPVPEQRAALWLAVKAGSVLEDDDQRGGAHFVEHLVFRGTKRFPGKAMSDFLESSGMSEGPDFNAYTDYDETVYQIRVPTTDVAVLLEGIDVLRDIAADVSFAAGDVEKERRIVLEEYRRDDVASTRAANRLLPVIWRGSRYADRQVIGTPESISSVQRAALSRFYRDWYRPDRMAVIAVGDFVDMDVESAIRARFGDLVPAANARNPGPPTVPRDAGLALAVTTDPEATSTSVTFFQKVARRRNETRRDYRRELDEILFAKMMDSRLADLRDDLGSPLVASSVRLENLPRSADTLAWSVTAKESRLTDAVRMVTQEIARVERYGCLPSELARQSAALLVSAEAKARENDKLPAEELSNEMLTHFLVHRQMPGATTELRWLREVLPKITVDEIREAAKVWSGDQGRIAIIDGPSAANPPRANEVRAIIEGVRTLSLPQWTDQTFDAPLVAEKPVPGHVVQSSWDRAAEATVWRLGNGVRVIVKATSFENDWIRVEGWQPGGSAMLPERDFAQARFAAEIMRESGAGRLSEREIGRALAGKDLEVDVDLANSYQTVTAETRPQDLETMLQLLHLRLRYPLKNDTGFTLWKSKRMEAERRRLDSPDERMNDEIKTVLYGNHPRYRPVTAEAIQEAKLERVFEIWKERFSDFNGFTFVFVGSVDLKKLRPLVETYLGSLPSRGRREHVAELRIPYPRETIERAVAAGAVDRSWVWICFTAPEHWSLNAERDARILETVLKMRLFEVMRLNTGGVYDLRSLVELDRDPTERHFLTVLFGCAPENVDKLRDTVMSELAEIARKGVGQEYLDKAAAQIRKKHEDHLKDNEWWLTQLRDAYRHDEDFAGIKDIEGTLGRITNDRIKATAARMVRGKPHIAISLRHPAPAATLKN